MDKRLRKQLVIGFIYLLIFGGAVYGLADRFFIIEPTCFDKVQNGLEEGVDCGTLACGVACTEPIKPLSVSAVKLLEVRSGDYDFVAVISNPNVEYGASAIEYLIPELQRSGTAYVLPGQTKYLVLTSLKSASKVSSVTLDIKSVQWEKVNIPAGKVNMVNRREVLGDNSFEGAIFNDSDYDFDTVDVSVILFDTSGGIIGVNKTEIKTLLSRTERAFRVAWPSLSGQISRTYVEASTNLFENSNFIRNYGTQERFQKFY